MRLKVRTKFDITFLGLVVVLLSFLQVAVVELHLSSFKE